MKILAIETSCDETAVSILACEGDETNATFRVLGNALLSQIDIHREYGGVFPAIAKREHAKNLVPVLAASLEEAELMHEDRQVLREEVRARISALLEREPELNEALFAFLEETEIPDIDAIAVTHGPGLVPALWVGVNLARALSIAWDKPLVGVNHMEGHLLSALSSASDERSFSIKNLEFPILGLLISGGHTELVSMQNWLSYQLVGQTKDDAVGEAYDKVARMLGLPYPGGPEISRLAESARERGAIETLALPRPMLRDDTYDFSFSGLKTAVLYRIKDHVLSDSEKEEIAFAFEEAVSDVLFAKTSRALRGTGAKMVVLGGGVSANTHIRRIFTERLALEHPEVRLSIPEIRFTTDNAIMIAIAGFYRALRKEFIDPDLLKADGNLALS